MAILLFKSSPTLAQIEAGNYPKKHIRFQGLPITIESPKGSVRRGKSRAGVVWKTTMHCDYGYIKNSLGVDGDHVDCYIGPDESATHAYVVHQRKAGEWKTYDEDKVMLGFPTESAARAAYLQHYDDKRFLGPITAMPMEEFKRKVLATKDKPTMIKAMVLFFKSYVPGHSRRLASGRVVQVKPYSDKRNKQTEPHPDQGDMFRVSASDELANRSSGKLPIRDIRGGDELLLDGEIYTVAGPIKGGVYATRAQNEYQTTTRFVIGDDVIWAKVAAEKQAEEAAETALRATRGKRGVPKARQANTSDNDMRNEKLRRDEDENGPYPQGRSRRTDSGKWMGVDQHGEIFSDSPEFEDMLTAANWSQERQLKIRRVRNDRK